MRIPVTRYIETEFVETHDGKFVCFFKWEGSADPHRIAIFDDVVAIENLKQSTITSLFNVYDFAMQHDNYIAIYADPKIEEVYSAELETNEKVSELLVNAMEWGSAPKPETKLYFLNTVNMHLINANKSFIHTMVKILVNPEVHDAAKIKAAHAKKEIEVDYENPLKLLGIEGNCYLGRIKLTDEQYNEFLKSNDNASDRFLKPYERNK